MARTDEDEEGEDKGQQCGTTTDEDIPRENDEGQQGRRKREGVRNGGEDRDNDKKREWARMREDEREDRE